MSVRLWETIIATPDALQPERNAFVHRNMMRSETERIFLAGLFLHPFGCRISSARLPQGYALYLRNFASNEWRAEVGRLLSRFIFSSSSRQFETEQKE